MLGTEAVPAALICVVPLPVMVRLASALLLPTRPLKVVVPLPPETFRPYAPALVASTV